MKKVTLFAFATLLFSALACSLVERTPTPTVPPLSLSTATVTAVVPASETPAAGPSATAVATTAATATSPPATATSPPATAVPATATLPPPTSTVAAQATRIQFEEGATSATVNGTIAAQEIDTYVLRALAGQIMVVTLTSPNNDVLLSVAGADGTVLKSSAVGAPSWQGRLPATQDYIISAVSIGQATDYSLQIAIDPPTTGIVPTRVQFQEGSVSATLAGNMAAGGDIHQYVLRALADQVMTVSVSSSAPGAVAISLSGADGSFINRAEEPNSLSAILPQTQDYLITVSTPGAAPALNYTLTVTIIDSPPAIEPTRVQFQEGSVSATLTGSMAAGGDIHQYVLRALAGQTMEITLSSATAAVVNFSVRGQDGALLGQNEGQDTLNVPLPSNQDYIITLITPGAAPQVDYTLTIVIE